MLHRMMTKRLILAVLLVLPVLSACRDSADVETAQFLVFGTLLDVSVRGTSADTADQAFQSLQQEFQRMHREWHAWEPGLLTEINAALAAGLPARANSDIIRMIRAEEAFKRRLLQLSRRKGRP